MIGRDGIRWGHISYRVNRIRSIGRYCIRWSRISYKGLLGSSIGTYGSRWIQIRYRGVLSRNNSIEKGGGWIRFKRILSRWVGIDTCCVGCILFRDNSNGMFDRGGSGNCLVRCRGNSCRNIGSNVSCCRKKCRGDSSIGGSWNRCRVNRSRRIGRDDSEMIGREASSCYCLQ